VNKVEQEADCSRFTGTVGTQKTEYLTLVYFKVKIDNAPVFTIIFGKVFGYEYIIRSFISANLIKEDYSLKV